MRNAVDEDQEIDTKFGNWVRGIRCNRSLSLKEAAQRGGLSPHRWASIERGAAIKAVRPFEAREIAKVLNVDEQRVFRIAAGEDE